MATGKPINVSLRVIADLSQGLYRSPADAFKELVSNAYDADSPTVEINFSKDFSKIIVRDFGKGMSIDDFVETMETIGGSSKRAADTESKEFTKSGRKIVGKIGIGLLSVSQIAKSLEIESTIEGSDIGFRANIQFDQFASEEARKIKITELWEKDNQIEIGRYYITKIKGVNRKEHFTTLKLFGIKRVLINNLLKEKEPDGYVRMLGGRFDTVEELFKWMRKEFVTKTALHEYDRIIWELCALCPVPYLENPLRVSYQVENSSTTSDFRNFANRVNKETNFELIVDGITCYKPMKMPNRLDKRYSLFFNLLFMNGLNDRSINYLDYNKDNKLVQKKLNVNGYIYFQRPKIWPPELQGILVRVRHVAVGLYDSTFLTYRRHEGFKFSQVTGEIYIDELDEALNIDRSSFRETEPSYVAFRDAIHKYLAKCVFPGIKEYASLERSERTEYAHYEEERNLNRSFKKIDNSERKLVFSDDITNIIQREKNRIILARTIHGKKFKFGFSFYKFIAFLEAKLNRRLTVDERDQLYYDLIDWLEEY